MKRLLFFLLLLSLPSLALSTPAPPVISVSMQGLDLSMSWNPVAGADGYRLSYAPLPDTGPQSIGTIDVGNATSYFYSLWEGAAFLVAVQAYDSQETSDYSNTAKVITPSAIAQGAPQLFYNLDDSIITISWQPVPNATGYSLNYSLSEQDSFIAVDLGNQTSLTYINLDAVTTYTIALKAYNDFGMSSLSNIETFTMSTSDDEESRTLFYGLVNVIPAGFQGTWNIGGHQLTTNPQTEFDQVDGPLIVDGCAKVDIRNGLVHEIESESIDDCSLSNFETVSGSTSGDEEKRTLLYGFVDMRPAGLQGTWTIDGRQFATNPQTEFDQVDGPLIVGVCAKVDLRNGLVHEIDSESIDDCSSPNNDSGGDDSGGEENRTISYGLVDMMPAGLQGTWTIDGRQFVTNPQTEYDQEDGRLIIGGCAKVDLRNGLVHEIDSEPIDDCR